MSRIISGQAGGTALIPAPSSRTRPTTDRTKEALFSWLESRGWLKDSAVLDLYAGSGALGAEAASRGAARTLGVESHRKTAAVAEKNVAAVNKVLGAPIADITTGTVQSFLTQQAQENHQAPTDTQLWDVVLADPPYTAEEDEIAAVIDLALPVMVADGLIVLERPQRAPAPHAPASTELIEQRRYGEAVLYFIRKVAVE